MSYLNLDFGFIDHRKTKRLVGLLGKGSEILLVKLWIYAGKYHADDGRFIGYSTQEIESIVGWWGQSGLMVTSMEKVGYLDKIEDGWEVHGWLEHQGHIAALKERARHAAVRRWQKISSVPGKEKSRASPDPPCPEHCSSPSLPSKPKRESLGVPGSGFNSQDLADMWNERTPAQLPKIAVLSDSRRKKALQRLRDHPGREFWERVIDEIKQSDFLLGNNDRGWRADFDWIITNDKNCLKIIEGKYRNTPRSDKIVGAAAPQRGKYAGSIKKPEAVSGM